MNETKSRLVTQAIGLVLLTALISASISVFGRAIATRFPDEEVHPCGSDRAVVFNNSEREIIVVGESLQEDGTTTYKEERVPPNRSSEQVGICYAYEMTVLGTKPWFVTRFELEPGEWLVLSDQYTYCISGKEPVTEIWYDVFCTDEPLTQ